MNIEATVVAEDPRYPLIVVTGDVRIGIRISRGRLLPVCLCSAWDESECCCDYGSFVEDTEE